jgi:hypothetical protein
MRPRTARFDVIRTESVRRDPEPEVAPNAIWPGQVQAVAYVLAALLGALVTMAGLCLLGCLLAWVTAEGPEMPVELAGLTRRQGVTAGIFAWVVGLVGYVWGRAA